MNERTLRTLEFARIKEMLASHAATSLGRELCEKLAPSVIYLEVKHWQDETAEARRLYQGGKSIPLGGIHDVRAAAQRSAVGGVLEPPELLDVADTISSGRRLKRFLGEHKEEAVILAATANMIGSFATIDIEIRRSITDHGEVADEASPALGQIRRAQRSFLGKIKERMESYVRGPSNKYLQDPIVTIRDGRYVVPVKIEYRAQVPGIVHDQSSSGSTLFIEPMPVVEMNNELKELSLKERHEVYRILTRLSGLVGTVAHELADSLRAFAQIDFASAKALLAMALDCVPPELERAPMLDIKKGRHPLLKGDVVPVGIHIGQTFDTLVITGPNTGGKTVTLKTMGLFVIMTQSGLQVPAAFGTRMGIFDQVFVDVGDEQSIEQSLSTFSSHMTNIVRIIGEIEGDALVLMDELGAGTDPTEGAALAMSILEHLHARGAKTVATTHYSELKTFAYSHPRVENASVEFDVETLRPTYRLLIGVPGSSNAFEISHRLGLSPLLVERARQFLTKEHERVEDLIAGIHATRAELEKDRNEAARLRGEAMQMRADYDKRYAGAQAKATEALEKARAQAAQVLAQARREAEAIIEELKTALKQQRVAESSQAISSARTRLAGARQTLLGDLSEGQGTQRSGEVPRNLRPGELVRMLSFGQTGYVLSEPDGSGNVIVQAGILKVTVPLTDLERAEESATPGKRAGATGTRSSGRSIPASKVREIATEVDLRGLMVDEALEKVDKYLDDAVLAGVPQVRIIHGKGTGALRKAVTDFLRGHRSVSTYRIGGMGEGGDGVTVVKLTE